MKILLYWIFKGTGFETFQTCITSTVFPKSDVALKSRLFELTYDSTVSNSAKSLLTKNMLNNKNVLNTTSNGEIDRTQLLIETIRAAQAAHAKQLESGQAANSDDETDAVVNPMEPEPNDLKKEKSDEDEIEIIHMTDEPESIR